jgi:hypothetical protein
VPQRMRSSRRLLLLSVGSAAAYSLPLSPFRVQAPLIASMSTAAPASSARPDQPVSSLLRVCKTACDEITELVEAVYAQLGKDPGRAVRKEDKSMFSLADGVVQARAPPVPPPSRAATQTPLALLSPPIDRSGRRRGGARRDPRSEDDPKLTNDAEHYDAENPYCTFG